MLIPPMPWDRQAHQVQSTKGGKVVLLHGLGRSWHAMNPLAHRLQHAGFSTLNLPYPSLLKPVDWILEHVERQVKDFAGDEPVHFVTHSLGGIVTRMILGKDPSWKMGRLVMLAPPSNGSEIIDWASESFFLKHLLSPAARSLATKALMENLPPLPTDLESLIIMGSRPTIPFFRKLLGPENDGIVSAERGRVPGVTGFSIVDADHTFIQLHPDAVRQILDFLEMGKCP